MFVDLDVFEESKPIVECLSVCVCLMSPCGYFHVLVFVVCK